MWERGVFIIIGLPNGTAVNQEMDQAFATFQPAVRRNTQRVVSRKLGARVAARKEARRAANSEKGQGRTPSGQDEPPPLADLDDILDFLVLAGDAEAEEEEGIVEEGGADKVAGPLAEGPVVDGVVTEQDHTIEHKASVMNVGLSNLDLGNMVNGYPGDAIEDKPFDNSFTRKSILSWWRKVGFLPMTRSAINDPKVRYELGEGGAPEDDGKRLQLLEDAYKEGAVELQRLGFNGLDTFDTKLPRAGKRKFNTSDEEMIAELMKNQTLRAEGCSSSVSPRRTVVYFWKRVAGS